MSAASTTRTPIALAVYPAAGVVLTLAVFNVAGWGVRWSANLWLALLFCGVAFFCEFLGLCLAMAAETQAVKKRWDRFAGAVFCLSVCATVNVVSGHNAWTTFEAAMLAPQIRQEQVDIDRSRADLLGQIAVIDRRLDAARPPPEAAIGPQSRAEARQVYQLEISRLQPSRNALQEHLNAMPMVAPDRRILPPWAVWAGFVAIELMKALVLWSVGFGDHANRLRSAAAGLALMAQEEKPRAPLPPPFEQHDEPLALGVKGRKLLDQLVESNVVSMTDIASKHAARPRPGARRAA